MTAGVANHPRVEGRKPIALKLGISFEEERRSSQCQIVAR